MAPAEARGEKKCRDGRNGLRLRCSYEKVRGIIYRNKKTSNHESDIQIRNSADVCYIDIEGTIVAEQWQFASPDDRVATYEKFRRRGGAHRSARRPQVVVNIRSTGGDVNDALLIYDALAALDAGDTRCATATWPRPRRSSHRPHQEGRREISAGRSTWYATACAAEGNAAELEARAELLRKTDERLAALYARRSGRPQEEFAQRMAENNGNGRWLSPEETVAAGLADRIVEGGETAEGERSAVRNLASGWNRLLAAFGLHGAAAPADAAREEDRRNILHLDDADPAAGRSAIEAAEGRWRHRATRECLRPKTRRSAKSAARPTRRLCRRRATVQTGRGYNGGRFPKNRRKIFLKFLQCFLDQAKHKKKGMKSILTFTLGKFRSFDSAFPARSRFTTFCHQKVAPKVSALRKTRGPADGLRLKRYAEKLAPAFSTAHPPPVLLPDFSQCGAVVRFAQR